MLGMSSESKIGDPRSGKFKHWSLFSKHISQAFAKTSERRKAGVCIGCGFKACRCKAPKRTRVGREG